ncbi:MAG: hypothetical protein LBH25_01075 [Fibromonadaceae bacterium]|jgi:hypothetical protein|nr:hypothetical protein [Fibromonadaceae bacterium]
MDDGDFAEVTGGEPTLWPHFKELLDYLESRRCHILVRTNGAKVFDLSKYRHLYVYLAQHDSGDEWINGRFRQFDCSGMIANKGSIPVMVEHSTIAEARITEQEPARFSETYFIDNEARIRFMPCDETFIGALGEGITADYRFDCFHMCPFKQGAWEVYKRLLYIEKQKRGL